MTECVALSFFCLIFERECFEEKVARVEAICVDAAYSNDSVLFYRWCPRLDFFPYTVTIYENTSAVCKSCESLGNVMVNILV